MSPTRTLLRVGGMVLSLGLACSASANADGRRAVAIERVFDGGRVVLQANAFSLPQPLPGGAAPYTQFIAPVGVAAGPDAFFVADAGLGRIFRFDLALATITPVAGPVARQETRLSRAADASLWVADGSDRARRYFFTGRPPQLLRPSFPGVVYDEVVADDSGAASFAFDRVQRRIDIVQAGTQTVVTPDVYLAGAQLLAAARSFLYVYDGNCHCVMALDTAGVRNWREIAGGFQRVTALAAFNSWLAVFDSGAARLVVLRDGGMHAEVAYGELGLAGPGAASIYGNQLFVADPLARRVVGLRLWP